MATPQSPPSACCSTCGQVVNYLRVKSNKNGNQGRLLAKCFSLNVSTGVRCDFWSWHPDSCPLASSPLQRCPSSDDLEPIWSAPGPSAPLATHSAPTIHAAKCVCSAPGCKSTRIRRDCSRLRCKTHCMELGVGCNSAAHKVNAPSSNLAHSNFQFPSLLPSTSHSFGVDPTLTASVNLQPIASSSSMPVTVPPNSQPTSSSSSGGPRHASHMTAFFTEQWATEHRLLEQKRTEDALRLAHAQKTKQTVYVYVWEHDNKDPLVVEFQDGFVWPYFILDTNVLRRVGLDSLPPFVSVNLYRPQLNMWTNISIEHVVHLSSDNSCIFLKPSTITHCKDLRNHTLALPSIRRIDITAERALMKSRMEQEHLERVCATLATPKRSLSPISASIPPPKRSRLTETLQVIPTIQPLTRSATHIVHRKKGDDLVIHVSDSEDEAPEPFSSPLRRGPDISSTRMMESLDDTQILVGRPKTVWPGARSVNEIVAGFKKIDDLSSRPGYTVSKAFEKCFDTRFPCTTFYDHRGRWNSASPTDRDAAQASNTSWASFAATHPSSWAAEKAACKRRQRLLRRVTSRSYQEDEVEEVE